MKQPARRVRFVCLAFWIGAAALAVQARSVHAHETSAPAWQARLATAGGVRLHCNDFGGDGLPVILVPAVTREATHYGPLGPLLTAGNRFLAVTRRSEPHIRRFPDDVGVRRASSFNLAPPSTHEQLDPVDSLVLDHMVAAYGVANLELDVPASTATAFPFASITKGFAGTAILRLVERGLLSLDDRVVDLLPEIPSTWSSVTVRQLLSHTSGLPDVALYTGVSNALVLRDLVIAPTLDSVMVVLPTMPMQFVPAHGVAYNQTNYLLLAILLERVDGRTIEDFVAEEFARPLGLTSLAFGDSRAVVRGRASWYTRMDLSTGQPEVVPVRPLWIEYPNFLHTAAGLNGTAVDLARFVAAVGSGELLGDAARREMWSVARLDDGSVARMGPFSVALGWFVEDPVGRSVTIGGGESGAVRYYFDDDLTVAVLTNLQGADPYALVDGVAKAFLREAVAP